MSEELTKKQSLDLSSLSDEELQKRWRDKNVSTRTKFNFISLDNSKLDSEGEKNMGFGTLTACRYIEGEQEVESLNKGFSFFPVYERVQIVCRNYINDGNGSKHPEYICKEVDRFEDIEVTHFETKEVVFTGPYKIAKEQYDLKYKVVIYAYYNDVMYRWLISGKETLGSWFAVTKEINDMGRPFEVKLRHIIPQNNNGIFWNDILFELGESFDIRKALELGDSIQFTKKSSSEAPVSVQDSNVGDLGEVVIEDIAL